MNGTAIYTAPYALDHVVTMHCREGMSIIEMDFWWIELWRDYDVVLWAANDNHAEKGAELR